MRLEFVSVEEFYFALTLTVRTLEELQGKHLVEQARSILQDKFGQPSTIAPGQQNTFNYVFRLHDYQDGSTPESSPETTQSWIVSISDWQDKLRLSSDYGWTLDQDRKPVRSDLFEQRPGFAKALRSHLQSWLGLPLESEKL